MAHLTKDDYLWRNECAWTRNMKNENKLVEQGISEDIADLISQLCAARHRMHCNINRIVEGTDFSALNDLIDINEQLREAGFTPMSFIPSYTGEYIDIDDLATLEEAEERSYDDEDYEEWRDDNYHRIYDELEELNGKIEGYLHEIDEKYSTNFAPTGAQRIF